MEKVDRISLIPDETLITIINNLLGTHESSDNLLNILSVCKRLNKFVNFKIKPEYVPFDIFIPLKNVIGKFLVYEFQILTRGVCRISRMTLNLLFMHF